MKIIEGHDIKIFTNTIEENAFEQIKELLSIDVSPIKRYELCPTFMPVPGA